MSVSYKEIRDIFTRGADPWERFQEIRFRSCSEARDQIVATMQFKMEHDFHNVVLTQADLCDLQEKLAGTDGPQSAIYRQEVERAQNEMISHMKFRRG